MLLFNLKGIYIINVYNSQTYIILYAELINDEVNQTTVVFPCKTPFSFNYQLKIQCL